MWRAPSESHDGSSDAAAPRRSRWLDIVNLVVSILILAIFVRLIPLFSAERDQRLLAERVARLEERVAALETTLSAVSSPTELTMGRLDLAVSQGSAGAAGFWIRNTGPNAAKNVSVVVALDAVAPPWDEAIDSARQLAVRTYPPSLEVAVQTTQIPTMPPELGGSTIAGENALELTLDALPPGGEWYVVVELSGDFPVEACHVVRSGRVQVSPSRFAPLSLSADSVEAMQIGVGWRLREEMEQHGWLAKLTATAECLNCGGTLKHATARLSALSGLSIRATPAVLLGDADTGYTVAWDATFSATLSRPSGVSLPAYCLVEGVLFRDASLFSTYPDCIFLYEFSPTSVAIASAQ